MEPVERRSLFSQHILYRIGKIVRDSVTERKAACLITAILRIKYRTIHAQKVSTGTRISRSRPPVADRALIAQVTITPVVGAR